MGKSIFIYSSVFILLNIFIGCTKMILEYENVGFFKLNEIVAEDGKNIEISGTSMHSSLIVDNIVAKRENNDYVILIYLSTANGTGKRDGNFDYKIKIDDNIKRILFGAKKKVIWTKI